MNRLEFNEVMKAVEIYNPLTTTGRYASSEQVHFWQDVAINFSGSYYAVVHGKIPLEVANIIYEKYPTNPYKIRVSGGCSDLDPKKCTRDDQYLDTYHIDTKEGLIIFLTEMKDYFARKNNLPETEVQRYDELMSTINTEILKKVNPTISAYEWMKSDEKNGKTFFDTIVRGTQTSFGKMFRKAIDEFDKAINPYENSDVELDDIKNYIKKVRITATNYNSMTEMERKNCCTIHIEDINSKNKVSYCRYPDGFMYHLECTLEENQYFSVSHSFSTNGERENDKGEEIYINYYGDNVKEEIDLRYNITHNVAGATYKEKTPITPEQKEFIYDELLKATSLAASITLSNMKKQKNVKILTLEEKSNN